MRGCAAALLLIVIFKSGDANTFQGSNSAQSSEPEIRAALCDLEKHDYVDALKKTEAILKTEPGNMYARKVWLGILTRQIRPGDRSIESLALIKKTIDAYSQARRDLRFNVEDTQQIDRKIIFLYSQLGEEELDQELQRRASDTNRSAKDRAEVYAVLASKSWDCAYTLTSKGRSLDKSEIETGKACVAKGLDYANRAITLDSQNESAWSYKASLFREASTLAGLEGNQTENVSYKRDSDAAIKRTTELADARREAEEKEWAKQEGERKNESFTAIDVIKAAQDLTDYKKQNSLDEAVRMIFMSVDMELTTLIAPVPVPQGDRTKTESTAPPGVQKDCFGEVKGAEKLKEKRAWKNFTATDGEIMVDLPDNVCSRGGGYVAASEGVMYSIDPIPRPMVSTEPMVVNAVLNTMARTFVGFRAGTWVSDGPTNTFEIKLLRNEDANGQHRKTYSYTLSSCLKRKEGVLIVHAGKTHYYNVDISGAAESDPRVQKFLNSLMFK